MILELREENSKLTEKQSEMEDQNQYLQDIYVQLRDKILYLEDESEKLHDKIIKSRDKTFPYQNTIIQLQVGLSKNSPLEDFLGLSLQTPLTHLIYIAWLILTQAKLLLL